MRSLIAHCVARFDTISTTMPFRTTIGLVGAIAATMLAACGGERPPTASGEHPTIDGAFELATMNGEGLPYAVGLSSHLDHDVVVPDTVFYAYDRLTFARTSDHGGTFSRTRGWIYRYGSSHPDSATANAGIGQWTRSGSVYVATYQGNTDSLTLDTDGGAITVTAAPTGFLPNGLVNRYRRTNP